MALQKHVNLIYLSVLMSTIPEKRQPKASAKLKDANNWSELQVKSHQHVCNTAIAEAEAAAKLKAQTSTSTTATAITLGASTSMPSSFPSITKRKQPPPEVLDSDDEADTQPKGEFLLQLQDPKLIFSMCFTASSSKKPRRYVISDNEVEIGASHPNTTTTSRPKPSDVDSSKVEQEAPKPTMKDRSCDIDTFFDEPAKVKDSNKPKRACKICRCTIFLVFLIYYCSIYVLNTGKRSRSNNCLWSYHPPSTYRGWALCTLNALFWLPIVLYINFDWILGHL